MEPGDCSVLLLCPIGSCLHQSQCQMEGHDLGRRVGCLLQLFQFVGALDPNYMRSNTKTFQGYLEAGEPKREKRKC